jgi:predicted PurR-regulated permease PerM
MKFQKEFVLYTALTILGIYFLFHGLVLAKAFLAPIALAMVLAFLMLPVSSKLERWGFSRIWATITSTLLLLFLIFSFVTVIFFQIRDFTQDWEKMQQRIEELVVDLEEYLVEKTPLTQKQTTTIMKRVQPNERPSDEQQSKEGRHEGGNFNVPLQEEIQPDDSQSEEQPWVPDDINESGQEPHNQENPEVQEESDDDDEQILPEDTEEQVMAVMSAVLRFITDFLIVLVYFFFFVHFRDKFRRFLVRLFAPEKRSDIDHVISNSTSVSRKYLVGKLLLAVILAIMYYVGLLLSGVENALMLALISAALSLIPFVGNFIGYFLSVGVSLVTAGGVGQVLGVTATFAVAQFIDSYILQPIVLGGKVGVHPFFIIFSVILGYEVWGTIGMVLSIPYFGILTIIARNVHAFRPLGYLLSNKEPDEEEEKKKEWKK